MAASKRLQGSKVWCYFWVSGSVFWFIVYGSFCGGLGFSVIVGGAWGEGGVGAFGLNCSPS